MGEALPKLLLLESDFSTYSSIEICTVGPLCPKVRDPQIEPTVEKSVLKMTTCMLTYADAFLVATHYLHYIRNYRQYNDDSKQLGSHAGCLQLFTILHEGIEHSKHLMFSGALESIPSG